MAQGRLHNLGVLLNKAQFLVQPIQVLLVVVKFGRVRAQLLQDRHYLLVKVQVVEFELLEVNVIDLVYILHARMDPLFTLLDLQVDLIDLLFILFAYNYAFLSVDLNLVKDRLETVYQISIFLGPPDDILGRLFLKVEELLLEVIDPLVAHQHLVCQILTGFVVFLHLKIHLTQPLTQGINLL